MGHGLALELKWRAEKWRKQSWFQKEGLPLSFWGEEWLGSLGGLLIKKPMFFDNYKTGVIYRDFVSLDDIDITKSVLNDIIAFDHLLSLTKINTLSFPLHLVRTGLVTYKSLILTIWARHYLGLSGELIPIDPDRFKDLFKELWTQESKPHKIKISMKESFLNWLSDRTGMDVYDISQAVGQTLERLFGELESEYGAISLKDLEPKYIHLFLLNDIK